MDLTEHEHLRCYEHITDFDQLSDVEKNALTTTDLLFLGELIPENQKNLGIVDTYIPSGIGSDFVNLNENKKLFEPIKMTSSKIKKKKKLFEKFSVNITAPFKPLKKEHVFCTVFRNGIPNFVQIKP